MAKRTTPADFYKMAVTMYGAEKSKSVTMPEVKAVAVKNDVQIPPYVVKQKVGRGRFNLQPEGTKDEPTPAKEPVKKDEPKKDSGKELSDDQLKDVVRSIVSDLKNMSRVYQTQDIDSTEYKGKKTFHGGVRDWGQWKVPDDAEDDGDYDWKVLTPEWSKKLKAFADQTDKKYPNLRIFISTEEKDWISVQVTNK